VESQKLAGNTIHQKTDGRDASKVAGRDKGCVGGRAEEGYSAWNG